MRLPYSVEGVIAAAALTTFPLAACAHPQGAADGPGCRATAVVAAQLTTAGVTLTLADPPRQPKALSTAPITVGGLWRGETPPLDLYRRWAKAQPASPAHCAVLARSGAPLKAGASTARLALAALDPAESAGLVMAEVGQAAPGARRELYFVRRIDGVWRIVGEAELSVS